MIDLQLNKELTWKIIALLNRGYKLTEICNEINCNNYTKLSRLINKLLKENILSKHYIPVLEALGKPISITILVKNQKTPSPCISRYVRSIISFYSYLGNPVEIYYLLDDCSIIEEEIDTSQCKLELCEPLIKTIIPLERMDSLKAELTPVTNLLKTGKNTYLDHADTNILLDIFRLYNPPMENTWKLSEIINMFRDKTGLKGIKYHYYSHIHGKYTIQHYTIKMNNDFSLILTYTPTMRELETLINTLLNNEFITGIWQISCMSTTPTITLIHAWSNMEKLVDPLNVHEYIKNTTYTVYPVHGVMHEIKPYTTIDKTT